MSFRQISLPKSIKVKVLKGQSGCFIAELPEYNISTEADSVIEIDELVNDLIYVYFDVPKEFRKEIRYVPSSSRKDISLKAQIVFQKFLSSDAQRLFEWSNLAQKS